MKIIPLIFNGNMVRALKEGRKTQTRRLLPDWQIPRAHDDGSFFAIAQRDSRYGFGVSGQTEDDCASQLTEDRCCPFGNDGDLIYVRETMIAQEVGDYDLACYAVDGSPVLVHGHKCNDFNGSQDHWDYHSYTRPSIHMPRRASRLTLKVTGVRVERVQDISEQDAIKEGFEGWDDDVTGGCTAFGEFSQTWCDIYGEESWNRNDWVWVIEFEVIHQNVDEYLKEIAA